MTMDLPVPDGVAAAAETAVAMLQALGTIVEHSGLRTRLVIQTGHVPCLTVTSVATPDLREVIRAARADGTWHYWWSWSEPISPDPAVAATRIRHVLGATTAADPASGEDCRPDAASTARDQPDIAAEPDRKDVQP